MRCTGSSKFVNLFAISKSRGPVGQSWTHWKPSVKLTLSTWLDHTWLRFECFTRARSLWESQVETLNRDKQNSKKFFNGQHPSMILLTRELWLWEYERMVWATQIRISEEAINTFSLSMFTKLRFANVLNYYPKLWKLSERPGILKRRKHPKDSKLWTRLYKVCTNDFY